MPVVVQSETSLRRSSLRPPTCSKIATTIMPRIAQARMQICVMVIAPSLGHVGPNTIKTKLTGARWRTQNVSTFIHCRWSEGGNLCHSVRLFIGSATRFTLCAGPPASTRFVIVLFLPITTQTRPDQNTDQGHKRNVESEFLFTVHACAPRSAA